MHTGMAERGTKRSATGHGGSTLPIGAAMRMDQRKKLKTMKTTSVSELEDRIAELEKELNSSSESDSDDESESDSENDNTSRNELVEVIDPEGNLVAMRSRLVGNDHSPFLDLVDDTQRKRSFHYQRVYYLIQLVEQQELNKKKERKRPQRSTLFHLD
jgi:uncharacterized small protein (DUF1192 family)